jgi:peptidoglycan/LPS O-acetylase OafA/YrhL
MPNPSDRFEQRIIRRLWASRLAWRTVTAALIVAGLAAFVVTAIQLTQLATTEPLNPLWPAVGVLLLLLAVVAAGCMEDATGRYERRLRQHQ